MNLNIPLKEIFDKLLENRLISRKTVMAIALGLMVFLLPLPQQYVITEGSVLKPIAEIGAEVYCLPAHYAWTVGFLAIKAMVIGIIAWIAIKEQGKLDRMVIEGNGEPKQENP